MAMMRESKGHTRIQWILAIFANVIIFIFGLEMGWVSPVRNLLQSTSSPAGRPLTDNEITWIASVISLTAMPGVLASSYVVDAYGRRIGILLVAALQAVCWLMKLCSSSVPSLMLARVCGGLATGGCFHVVPMYIKEISHSRLAGTLGSLVMLSQNVGVLCMYALGGYLSYNTVLWIVLLLPIIIFLVFLKAPESPAYLVKMGKIEEATEALVLLRGLEVDDKELLSELNAIKNEEDYFKSLPKISYSIIFKHKAWRRGFFIMLLVGWTHGYNGTYAIVSYATSLLSNSGFTMSPELQSLFVPLFMTVGSITSVIIIDKIRRKVLLSLAYASIALGLSCLATTQLVHKLGGTTPSWLPILAMTIALYGQSVGVSPGPYVVMLEMFNFQIRAKLMGIIILNIWFMSTVQLLSLDVITTYLGSYSAFYWFAGVNVLGVLVVLFLMPETRGKSVEQIENELRGIKGNEEK